MSRPPIPQFLDSPIWCKVGNPLFPGHDAADFRNARACNQASILVVGDSWTYGFGVDAAQSWPFAGAMQNLEIYCAASNDWSLWQYYLASRRYLHARMRNIVIALYLGNDVGCLMHDIKASEAPERDGYWSAGDFERLPILVTSPNQRALNRVMTQHQCRLEDALSICALDEEVDIEEVCLQGRHYFGSPRRRKSLTDVRGSQMQATRDLFSRLLTDLVAHCDEMCVDPLFVLLPSKEALLGAQVAGTSSCEHLFQDVCRSETDLEEWITERLGRLAIQPLSLRVRFLDRFPHCFAERVLDGHPRAEGYALISEAVAEALRHATQDLPDNSYPFM